MSWYLAHPWVLGLFLLYLLCARRCFRYGATVRVVRGDLLHQAARRSRPWSLWIRHAAVLALLMALAGPYGERVRSVPQKEGYEIVLLLDASYSMREDRRFETAQKVLRDFIRSRGGDRTGVVVFGDRAYLLSPLSSDAPALGPLVERLRPGVAGGRDTALYEALWRAADLFGPGKGENRIVILLTDGIDTVGNVPLDGALSRLRSRGVRVFAVGVGDDFRRAELERIARATHGAFFAAPHAVDLGAIYRRIDRIARGRIVDTPVPVRRDWRPVFLALAMGLMGLGLVFGPAGRSRSLTALALAALAWSRIGNASPMPVKPADTRVILGIDLSRSMDLRDLPPDRLRYAKALARDLLGRLPGVEAGLVAFDRRGYRIAAPTRDHAALQRLLEGIDPSTIRRSVLADPAAAIRAAEGLTEGDAATRLILFSAAALPVDADRLARRARSAGIVVDVAACATGKAAAVRDADGTPLLDPAGNPIVPIPDPSWEALAGRSGGVYLDAREGIDTLARRLASKRPTLRETGEDRAWIWIALALGVYLLPLPGAFRRRGA